jgi:hypothetical protein
MNYIGEKILLKTKWDNQPFEVYIKEYHQSIKQCSNNIEMIFHCLTDGNTYHYYWDSTPSQGIACLKLNGFKSEDISMQEIGRQLSIWLRQQITLPTPIITY